MGKEQSTIPNQAPGDIKTVMRLPSDLHKALRMLAASRQQPMNDLVVSALRQYVEPGMAEMNVFLDGWLAAKRGEGILDAPDPAAVKKQNEELSDGTFARRELARQMKAKE